MENKIIFGKWETAALLVNAMCARIFLNFPRPFAESAGTAGWIVTIFISILIFIIFMIISKLYTPFDGKDLIDIAEYIGGPILRVFIGIIITGLLIFISSVILREYGENMKVVSLTVSPLSFVLMFFAVGMIVGAYSGIESIVRFHAIIVPVVIIGLLIILVGVESYFDISNIFPILGNGADAVFGKGTLNISLYSPLFYILLMSPFIKTHKNFKSAGMTGIGISAVLLTFTSFIYLTVYPYPSSIENFLPVYQLARLINYGRFFQRVESIFMLIWAASALMYLSVILFFITYIFKKTFGLEYYKPLIIPFAIIIFSLSLLPESLVSAISLETVFYVRFVWIVVFAMPIILLTIANAVKGHKKKERAKCE